MNNKREARRRESESFIPLPCQSTYIIGDFELYERTSIRPTQDLCLKKEEPQIALLKSSHH